MTDADCHAGRAAALVTALGPARLWALVAQFRADLAALAETATSLDGKALAQQAHRLHGAGSTLGFDAAAAALAAVAEDPGLAPEGLANAAAALARGEQALSHIVPAPAEPHAPEASKR